MELSKTEGRQTKQKPILNKNCVYVMFPLQSLVIFIPKISFVDV